MVVFHPIVMRPIRMKRLLLCWGYALLEVQPSTPARTIILHRFVGYAMQDDKF